MINFERVMYKSLFVEVQNEESRLYDKVYLSDVCELRTLSPDLGLRREMQSIDYVTAVSINEIDPRLS